VFWLKTLLC